MGLHHHHETDMICHRLTIALEDVREVHEGIIDFARSIHHPRLLGFAQETFQSFAHNRASDIEHEVGDIGLIIAHK